MRHNEAPNHSLQKEKGTSNIEKSEYTIRNTVYPIKAQQVKEKKIQPLAISKQFQESIKIASHAFPVQNMSVEALTISLSKLADIQINDSIAVTGLRRILIELGNENSKAAKAVGFTVKNTNDYVKALKILKAQNLDATRADELFGKNAVSTALNLIKAADLIETYISSLENAGAAINKQLQYGDKARIVELTKTKGLNEGKGYSYAMVVKVLRGEKQNDQIVELVKEYIKNRNAFKATLQAG